MTQSTQASPKPAPTAPTASTDAALPDAPLLGPAAIEPGCAPEAALERLRAENPQAQARAAERAQLWEARAARLSELLQTRFGVAPDGAQGGPLIPAERHYELAQALKQELGYTQYVTVCASHWPAQQTRSSQEPEYYEVATVLRMAGPASHAASWRVRVPAEIDSLVPLFAGADWQEREQFDLVGVVFRGHPDLRRLMLPEEWEGHPLRKDYAIDTRCEPWR